MKKITVRLANIKMINKVLCKIAEVECTDPDDIIIQKKFFNLQRQLAPLMKPGKYEVNIIYGRQKK